MSDKKSNEWLLREQRMTAKAQTNAIDQNKQTKSKMGEGRYGGHENWEREKRSRGDGEINYQLLSPINSS